MSNNDPVIIKIAQDTADTAATVRSIKERQEENYDFLKKSIEAIESNVKTNGHRITNLEKTRDRVIYTAGGVSAGIALLYPKVASFITTLFH
jgi:hypothetical protein